MKYLIELSYDGSKFYGFQKQSNKETVQGNVESILSKILNEKITTIGASRTDRGVHAYSQFISFETNKIKDVNKFVYSINQLLNEYIHIKNINIVNDEFSPRYDVVMKEYIYKINVGEYNPIEKDYVYQYNKSINISLIKKAIKKIKGKHNFKSFTSDTEKEDYVRDIKDIKIIKKDNYIYIYIKAKSFLRYMIRNIVGLLIDINESKKTIDDIDYIFKSEDRKSCGRCIDACGLYLNKIYYK
jgi:tRNA pseudouridine38-40 synthase